MPFCISILFQKLLAFRLASLAARIPCTLLKILQTTVGILSEVNDNWVTSCALISYVCAFTWAALLLHLQVGILSRFLNIHIAAVLAGQIEFLNSMTSLLSLEQAGKQNAYLLFFHSFHNVKNDQALPNRRNRTVAPSRPSAQPDWPGKSVQSSLARLLVLLMRYNLDQSKPCLHHVHPVETSR
jgi:hypothetical protein